MSANFLEQNPGILKIADSNCAHKKRLASAYHPATYPVGEVWRRLELLEVDGDQEGEQEEQDGHEEAVRAAVQQ